MISGAILRCKSIRDFHSLTKSDVQHQHNQCECQSITKRDTFELLLNILAHYLVECVPWNSSKFLKFKLILSKVQMKPMA